MEGFFIAPILILSCRDEQSAMPAFEVLFAYIRSFIPLKHPAAPTGWDIIGKGRLRQPRPEQILLWEGRLRQPRPERILLWEGTPAAAPTGADACGVSCGGLWGRPKEHHYSFK